LGRSGKGKYLIGNSRGSALLAALTYVVFSSMVAMAAFSIFGNYQMQYFSNRLADYRGLFAIRMSNLSMARDIQTASMMHPANDYFHKCLVDNSAIDLNVTDDCTAQTRYPIVLVENQPTGPQLVYAGNSVGTAVSYSFTGKLCALAGVDCTSKTFAVWTEFSAYCQGGAAACRQADTVDIYVHIIPSSDMKLRPIEIARTSWINKYNNRWQFQFPALVDDGSYGSGNGSQGGGGSGGGGPVLIGGGSGGGGGGGPLPPAPATCGPGFRSINQICMRFNL
jgi:uncharacterized membrane protein YgcG